MWPANGDAVRVAALGAAAGQVVVDQRRGLVVHCLRWLPLDLHADASVNANFAVDALTGNGD